MTRGEEGVKTAGRRLAIEALRVEDESSEELRPYALPVRPSTRTERRACRFDVPSAAPEVFA